MSEKIWIVSELYYPEDTSTGFFLTHIAEGLASESPVSVLCSQPTYSERGTIAPSREQRHGVSIIRCWGTRLDRQYSVGRLLNLCTFSCSVLFHAVLRFRRDDKVLVVTNPPLLPFLVALACRIRHASCCLLVHDVYPEVIAAAGVMAKGSIIYRVLERMSRRLLKSVSRVVVLGRDMAQVVAKKGRKDAVVITNWGETDKIVPLARDKAVLLKKLGIQNDFVVQYCGNMGRTHGLDVLMAAAAILKDKVHFLMIGSGAKLPLVRSRAEVLPNVTVLDRCPREMLGDYLNACDLAVISFAPGMAGLSVPSRMYNVMAAGKPILAIAEPESELAMVVQDEGIGYVTAPGNVDGIVRVIEEARANPDLLLEMGKRARKAAEEKYNLPRVIGMYRKFFSSL